MSSAGCQIKPIWCSVQSNLEETWPEHSNGIPKTRVRVPVEIHVFHINKSCFQLENALASGSIGSTNLG